MALASSSFKTCLAWGPGAPVLSPSDPERIFKAVRRANGIPIDDTTWGEILEVPKASGLGVEQIEGIL